MIGALLLAALASVHGTVVYDGTPAPGVTVSIGSAKTLTDTKGNYVLRVAPGAYDLDIELAGFGKEQHAVRVHAGENDLGESRIGPITTTCEMTLDEPCVEQPDSEWSWVSCADYRLDNALEESAKNGDRSAIELLEKRHDSAYTYDERHRIAGMLLRRVRDDSKYWDELITLAGQAMDLLGDEAARKRLEAYCLEHSLDPDRYAAAIEDALIIVGSDARSRGLLRSALESADHTVRDLAIMGFAEQRDEGSLDLIDKVLKREGDRASSAAFGLIGYRSAAADEVAMRYLTAEDRKSYLEYRNAPERP